MSCQLESTRVVLYCCVVCLVLCCVVLCCVVMCLNVMPSRCSVVCVVSFLVPAAGALRQRELRRYVPVHWLYCAMVSQHGVIMS